MMRPRRASVIFALSLVSSAAMASAERAWVLWTHFTEAETGKPDRTTLNPTSAFESKMETPLTQTSRVPTINYKWKERQPCFR